jgi:hypothetical protein
MSDMQSSADINPIGSIDKSDLKRLLVSTLNILTYLAFLYT